MTNNLWLKMFDSFYRSGSLVFGGGHVVLPLLKNEFVPSGLISPDNFITGYAAAQAVPGPLFTFASYIGMSMEGIGGAILATIAIFLPAFLLLFGILLHFLFFHLLEMKFLINMLLLLLQELRHF